MILWRMKTLMNILCLFVVFSGVSMKSDNVFEGTVGEKVEIRCPYPDDHKYTPKYLCRDPCGSSGHVLIKSAKTDKVVSDGRYSLINSVSGRFFTVTISDLRLKDSGVYYCGVDKWFRDKLSKVNLSVRQAAPANRPSHTSEKTITTTSTWTTTTLTSTDKDVTAVCAGVMSFLVFWILVALVFIYRKRSDAKFRCTITSKTSTASISRSSRIYQTVDDVCYLCEGTIVVYILDDPPKGDSSSLLYSTVHYCDDSRTGSL